MFLELLGYYTRLFGVFINLVVLIEVTGHYSLNLVIWCDCIYYKYIIYKYIHVYLYIEREKNRILENVCVTESEKERLAEIEWQRVCVWEREKEKENERARVTESQKERDKDTHTCSHFGHRSENNIPPIELLCGLSCLLLRLHDVTSSSKCSFANINFILTSILIS